jgi:integrative and conjugative element protein (TIGR02256 family)
MTTPPATAGQRLAIEQLRRTAALSGGRLVILGEQGPDEHGLVGVDATLSLEGMETRPGGLPLRQREAFRIGITTGFPFAPPTVHSAHIRWAGTPHVQFADLLCLYSAPAVEWNPADGIHGLLDRLERWLRQAAVGALDPAGMPLHPPVTYRLALDTPLVVPRADVGEVANPRLVFARLQEPKPGRVDVVGWERSRDNLTPPIALVALTPGALGFTFPHSVSGLLTALNSVDLPMPFVVTMLLEAAAANPPGSPLLVLIGTAARGIQGGPRTQHLAAWRIPAGVADKLRTLHAAERAEHDRVVEELTAWAGSARVDWCEVREARREVTVRRDAATPMAAFAGLRVEVWGCGALGGWIADCLVRAGVARLVLRDQARVGPGVLVRQPYEDGDIGDPKAEQLARRLRRVAPEVEVVAHWANLLDDPLETGLPTDVDLVIDATASRAVASKLERAVARQRGPRPVLAAVMTCRDAERGLLLVAGVGPSGGPLDLARKAQLAIAPDRSARHFHNAFWRFDPGAEPFQPEPGCSEPTFRGSAADAIALAGSLLSLLGRDLHADATAAAHLITLPHARLDGGDRPAIDLAWDADRVLVDQLAGYQVRISPDAEAAMRAAIAASITPGQRQAETGGLLFGERDDAAGIVWVSQATGPPADSQASEHGFVCGTAGVAAFARRLDRSSNGAVRFVGMWHTHPDGAPAPSPTDHAAMAAIMAAADSFAPRALLLIAGGDLANPDIGAFAYRLNLNAEDTPIPTMVPPETAPPGAPLPPRAPAPPSWAPGGRPSLRVPHSGEDSLASPATGADNRDLASPCQRPMPAQRGALDPLPPGARPLGVALSGGGFRATLAGLGVLRYLTDVGLLGQVRLVSSVSGGSIANGLLAVAYDQARTALFEPEAVDRLVIAPAVTAITTRSLSRDLLANAWRALPPGVTRTHLLDRLLDQRFFAGRLLRDLPTGCWFMFNAANVATGARFRFDRDLVGDYVLGSAATAETRLRVSTAVAASAAVPGLFPPLPLKDIAFACGDAHQARLVDGGVYDNLGLEPITKRAELFLVALNAGGLFHTNAYGTFSRIPVLRDLERANALLYRQVSALRSRWLFDRLTRSSVGLDNGARLGVLVALATQFNAATLSGQAAEGLAEWHAVAPEQDPVTRHQLSRVATSFGRFPPELVEALLYLGWWLCGAAFAAYHRELLPDHLPSWRPLPGRQ